jgi:hypothetical protein
LRRASRTRPGTAASVLAAACLAAAALPAAPAGAAAPPTLDLRVLLVGAGSTDPTTAAWESAMNSEGVAFTEVDAASGSSGLTVTLPALSSGTTGYFNGVVLADQPSDFAAGQLSALDSYESTFGVRQIDGYVYPTSALGETAANGGNGATLDGTNGTVTAAGLTALPELAGTVPFDTGTYGYPATAVSGAPFTPWLDDSAGDVLAGVYAHPSTDPQAGVSELVLNFDYNADQLQWLVLAPGLINWVTQDAHLGLYRNYVEMDIDDTFTPDDAWDTTTHENDYTDADALRMQAADVVYAAKWEASAGFRMDQLFNGGGSVEYQADNGGTDPVLGEFQATDPATGKSYADDFGWLSHTYDTPYLDVGCATQNYIEAELNENTSWAAAAPGSSAGTGGLALTESSAQGTVLGAENPQVFVPGNHSGLADLEPGNPATVDPPDLDPSTVNNAGGSLTAGSYEYAITDQFTNSPAAGQSQAYIAGPFQVPAGGSVTLQWESICHASDYLVYREVTNSNDWSLIGTVSTPSSATLPDNSSGDPASTTDVTGGGELEQTFNDTGVAGTAQPAGWTPPTDENAVESPWEQNPYFIPALEAVGITTVGADASKAYPDPPDTQFGIGANYSGPTYAAGQTFVDGDSQVVPRHPINIYYNASTEAQEVDEYNTLYLSSADGGSCQNSATTTCLTAPATFSQIVGQVDEGMMQNLLGNDPRPSYVHQTNIMGQPPASPSGTPPNTPDTTGDGLLYSVLNPLLSDYHSYFSSLTPFEQPALGQIGDILADQAAWSGVVGAGTVNASETNGVITVSSSASGTVQVPVTAPTGSKVNGTAFGQAYGGALSAWDAIGSGGSTTITTPAAPVPPAFTSAAAATFTVGTAGTASVATSGSPASTVTESGALPSGVTFTAGSGGTATIAGTPAAGTGGVYSVTLTAQNSGGSASQTFVLTVDQAPAFTSAATAKGTMLTALTFTVTTSGFPAVTSISESGLLPAGLSFTSNANGTATISGTPLLFGSTKITLTAKTAVGTATQALTINIAL